MSFSLRVKVTQTRTRHCHAVRQPSVALTVHHILHNLPFHSSDESTLPFLQGASPLSHAAKLMRRQTAIWHTEGTKSNQVSCCLHIDTKGLGSSGHPPDFGLQGTGMALRKGHQQKHACTEVQELHLSIPRPNIFFQQVYSRAAEYVARGRSEKQCKHMG
jgi:hypothetical protein